MCDKKWIKGVDLAYWYFRLNGFLTIKNFVVHPDYSNEQKTDVDILGVRFTYRAELPTNPKPMKDRETFTKIGNRHYIVLAEVTIGECKINPSWENKEKKSYHSILSAIGAFQGEELIDKIAQELYGCGVYENKSYYVSLFSIGEQKNDDLQKQHQKITQETWYEILTFIHNRFKEYREVKSSHGIWDDAGLLLWNEFDQHRDEQDEFINSIKHKLI